MTKIHKKKVVINIHDDGQANVAFDKSNIKVRQVKSIDAEKDISAKVKRKNRKFLNIFFIMIFSICMISVISLIIYNKYLMSNNEIHKNESLGKAMALEAEGKYLEAAVVFSELYVSWKTATDYQLELVKFCEAYEYYAQIMFNGDAENQCRYRAIDIFEEIANTKSEEYEDIRLLSIGYLILLTNDLYDMDYEKKLAGYCKIMEETIINYNSSIDEFHTYNIRMLSYFALAEYYCKYLPEENSFIYLELITSYYHEALNNCKKIMKYELGTLEVNAKKFEILLLQRLSTYYPSVYYITGDENYLHYAESCFDEVKAKVDVNTNSSTYVNCMIHVAQGKIIIGRMKDMEEAYQILDSLFYRICKDEMKIFYIGNMMISPGVISELATEDDINNVKEYNSKIIEKLKDERDIPAYVDALYKVADSYWYLAYYYHDKEAYDEGYSYLLELQNMYLDLVESNVKNDILMIIKDYESYLEY